MTKSNAQSRPALWKGAVAGLAGGLAASLAMDGFQRLLAVLSPPRGGRDEPSMEKAADRVADAATGSPVSDGGKPARGRPSTTR